MALCHLRLIRKAFWESSDNTYEEQLNLSRENFNLRLETQKILKRELELFLTKETLNLKVISLNYSLLNSTGISACSNVTDSPHPHASVWLGLLNINPEFNLVSS